MKLGNLEFNYNNRNNNNETKVIFAVKNSPGCTIVIIIIFI